LPKVCDRLFFISLHIGLNMDEHELGIGNQTQIKLVVCLLKEISEEILERKFITARCHALSNDHKRP